MSEAQLTVGVVGLGYWGPNLARNFDAMSSTQLRWCCDGRAEVRDRHARQFRDARFTADLDDLLSDPQLDAVVLATPVPSHADLAVRVLEAGKHCFVEKPLAQSVADAERAVDAPDARGRCSWSGTCCSSIPASTSSRRSPTPASWATSATSTATV